MGITEVEAATRIKRNLNLSSRIQRTPTHPNPMQEMEKITRIQRIPNRIRGMGEIARIKRKFNPPSQVQKVGIINQVKMMSSNPPSRIQTNLSLQSLIQKR